MKRNSVAALLVVAELFLLAGSSSAIPAYARKYGFNCNMCHTAYPKLNDFGQRFRDDGYQVAGQEGKEATVFATPPPIAMRTTAGLSVYDSKAGSTAGFNLFGLDLLASGVLHKNVSFLLIYTPRIDEPAADHTGEGPAQTGALESAALVFSNIIPNALNLRVGRFEPATHAFSSKRSYFLFAPYEMYGFTTPSSANPFSFDDNQIGAEATGHFRNGFKYGVGFVNGTGANPDNNKNKDVYANLFKTLGRGDGQSAGQRIGVFGYYGWQPTKPGTLTSPTGEGNGSESKAFYRFGANGSLNWRTWNLELMWMKGFDDKAFHAADPSTNYEYSGLFAELDWAALMNNRLIASVLYNRVSPPASDVERQVSAVSGLVRYYLGDWSAVNVSVHAELTHRTFGKDVKVSENLFALLLDFAF
jgi:hypothetical protein